MELEIKNLNKFYGSFHAVKDLSFTLRSGEIVGLLGHNGAGKSTLIKCIMNAITSYDGEILIDGHNIREEEGIISRTCSFLLEPSFCEYLSARQNLELLAEITRCRSAYSIDDILTIVSLRRFSDRKVSEFSFGMKQRLGLAQVMLSRPYFVILDEPTVGLDPLGIDIIKVVIRKLSEAGIAVLFSSHQISDVFDVSTRAIVVNSGSVVYDGETCGLIKKKYVLTFDKEFSTEQISEKETTNGISTDERTVFVEDADLLEPVLIGAYQQGIHLTDIETVESLEYLKSYMNSKG